MAKTKAEEREYQVLVAENARFRDLLAGLTGKFPGTRVSYRPALIVNHLGLPDDSTVRFRLGSEDLEYVDVSLDDEDRLTIRGGYILDLRPEAANTVTVGVRS